MGAQRAPWRVSNLDSIHCGNCSKKCIAVKKGGGVRYEMKIPARNDFKKTWLRDGQGRFYLEMVCRYVWTSAAF